MLSSRPVSQRHVICSCFHRMTSSVACSTLQFLYDQVSAVVSQSGCDRGPALSSEFSLMEMTEVKCSHLSSHHEAKNDCPASPPSRGGDDLSTLSAAQQHTLPPADHQEPKDLVIKACSDPGSSVTEGEKTPTGCVEVPYSVLAMVEYATDCSVDPSTHRAGPPLQPRLDPPARVCLEKRFTCSPCNKTRQDPQVLNTFLSMFHQPTDTQGIELLSQSENWPKAENVAPADCAYPHGGAFLNSCAQGLNHLLEVNKHPEVILPKNFTLSYRPERTADFVLRAPYVIHTEEASGQGGIKLEGEAEEMPASLAKPPRMNGPRVLQLQDPNVFLGPGNRMGGCKRGRRTGPPLEFKHRRERHNSKERDRRRRIKLSCDELKLLVPFCSAETDKATTLEWTTAFLVYIRDLYGDSLKQNFEKMFSAQTGVRMESSSTATRGDDAESKI